MYLATFKDAIKHAAGVSEHHMTAWLKDNPIRPGPPMSDGDWTIYQTKMVEANCDALSKAVNEAKAVYKITDADKDFIYMLLRDRWNDVLEWTNQS